MPNWFHEEFMTVAEVAALLRLNQQTIRNWIAAGTLPAVRIGRRVRVLRSDLDRLIDDSAQGPTSPMNEDAGDAFWRGEWTSEVVVPDGEVEIHGRGL